jgi:hypothetical protein
MEAGSHYDTGLPLVSKQNGLAGEHAFAREDRTLTQPEMN